MCVCVRARALIVAFISDFPIRKLLNGATRMGESIMLGRVYQKAEGFLKAKEDFLSLNPKVVFESDKVRGLILFCQLYIELL